MNGKKASILAAAEAFAREALAGDASGHDITHVERVARWARRIAEGEGADPFVCELAAWLHDVADEKLNESEAAGMRKVEQWLSDNGVDTHIRAAVLEIVGSMSFRGGGRTGMATAEGRVVQDADRLDALGAIGIARTFAYSGSTGRPIHDPGQPARDRMSPEEYRRRDGTAINHFYEKLLKLKDRMNTETGRRLAEERHRFMEQYLQQFYREWNAADDHDEPEG